MKCSSPATYVIQKKLLFDGHFTLREKLDHGWVKGRQIFGAAAAHPVAIAYHFLINPLGTSIADIVLDGVIAGHSFTLDQASRNEQPWCMTDYGNRFTGFVGLAH